MNEPDLKVDERGATIETTEELLSRLQQCDPVRGVNVCGYLRTESGVGEAARRYIRALQAASIPVALHDLSAISGNRAQDQTLDIDGDQEWYDLNLICVDIDLHYAALYQLGEQFLKGRYNIALWWWEQPAFPQKWADRFAYYDEVWAGSTFIANTLAPVSPVPVVRVPPALDGVAAGSRQRGRAQLGLSEETYTYLFIFDFHSHIERKNPLGLIRAFKRAFAPGDAAQLVIKCVNGASNPAALAEMHGQADGVSIVIHEGYWPAEKMRDLLAACDAYVSLHRSEGAGLPIADAMAAGKPVIATGWSGNMEFMNANNSFPVGYEMVELDRNVGPYRAGELWAEPSIEHAAELMRRAYEDRELARRRGLAAQRTIEREYSAARSGRLIAQRLQSIALQRQLPQFRQAVQERYRNYQQLPARIREIADRVLPPEAPVAVVSKGDDELLRLNGRTAWHYPQDETGEYRGYYPADSAEAIAHLQTLQAQGAEFLLLPCSAYWWLEHYGDFAGYLESAAAEAWSDESCTIYRLAQQPGGATRLHPAMPGRAIEIDALSAMERQVRHKVRAFEAQLAAREAAGARPTQRQPIHRQPTYRPPMSGRETASGPDQTVPAAPVAENDQGSSTALRKRLAYPQTIAHIQETVRVLVPPEATLVVVSKGDDELLELGRPAWHFPRQEDGTYAGYYPATGRDALEHLEALQAEGAEFLILPNTAFWWLDHYAALQDYLVSNALWIHKDEWCIIYRLPRTPRRDNGSPSLWYSLTRPFRTRQQS